jgi:putative DNA primase/helicase
VANTAATPAKDLLTFQDAVAATKAAQGRNGWYNGLCPAHRDTQPSLGLNERLDGSFAIKCQAGCTRQQVIEALEQQTGKKLQRGKKKEERPAAPLGITLQQYADLKKLPIAYLQEFSTFEVAPPGAYKFRKTDVDGNPIGPLELLQSVDHPAVVHTYYDDPNRSGRLSAVCGFKYRLSVDSHKTLWCEHTKSVPYGLAHLWWHSNWGTQRVESIVICEGESDTQTLWFAGVPAIGISGKNGWQEEFANLPLLANVKEVYIVQEPDSDFAEQVGPSFEDKKVYVLPFEDPIKDPSALWISNPDVDAFWRTWNERLARAQLTNDGFANTDTGNAERLVAKHGPNFRWLTDAETFAVWNGRSWCKNESGDILLPVTKEVARSIPNDDWRAKSESSGHRRSMIAMAKGEREVLALHDIFDRHPMLLNVENGTLDLETQELRPFCREDFLTKKARVAHDDFAGCPKFDAFMEWAFAGDQEVIHFMDKALGYTLTGSTAESVFFICYGLGANGKTTLIEVMTQILGPDFVHPAKFSTFVSNNKMNDPKYELATFKGSRLVTAVEPRKAGHLDEEVLKQVTGGDQIMARDIYEKNTVYYPEFKLWLAMNNMPRIVGTDEGIWRRTRLIKFSQRIDDSMKVKDFHKVLFHEEGPGILNRLLRGLQAWQEEGLEMPSAIANATAEFRAEQNVIQRFFDEHTLAGKRGYHAKAGALYDRYKQWADDENEAVLRSNEFAEELKRRNFEKRRVHDDGYHWYGVALKSAPTESEPSLGPEDGEPV